MKKLHFNIFLGLTLCFSATAFAQKTLPAIHLKTLEGKAINAQNVAKKGKITVFSFWATWCAPCKKELDAISSVYPDWQKKYNVDLVAVSVDDARGLPKVKPMVAQKGWKYNVFSDTNQELQRALNIQSVPHTVLIDTKGQIVYQHSGYIPGDEKELEKKIQALKN